MPDNPTPAIVHTAPAAPTNGDLVPVVGQPVEYTRWVEILAGASRTLAQAHDAIGCLEVANTAEAVRKLLKQARALVRDQNLAGALKVRAERKAGEMLQRMSGLGKGGDRRSSNTMSLGLPRDVPKEKSSRAQAIAAIPDEQFEQEMSRLMGAHGRRGLLVTSQQFIRMGREHQNRERRRREAEKAPKALPGLRLGDFRFGLADVPDESVALILTDPPYERKSLGLYADLAGLADRILVPGGSLIAYAGNYLLPEVLPALTQGRMRYCWTLVVLHEGRAARYYRSFTFADVKPLVWFTKGNRRGRNMVGGLIRSVRPDKALHEWEQSVTEATYLIERLTDSGELVLDPMCGSGTTLLAAARLGRRYLGCEIDEQRMRVAAARLQGESR
jgi:hypothetical protein